MASTRRGIGARKQGGSNTMPPVGGQHEASFPVTDVEASTNALIPTTAGAPVASARTDLREPTLYLNRELSQLALVARVFEEAQDEQNPLLERVKFLSICGMLLDEFYETRVAMLRDQLLTGQIVEAGRDALPPKEQLDRIHVIVQDLAAAFQRALAERLIPQLAAEGIRVLDHDALPDPARAMLRAFFEREIFPLLTPLAVDAGRPFPHISGRSLNLLVVIRDELGERFARVKVPPSVPRLISIPPDDEEGTAIHAGHGSFTWVEQLIAANASALFPGKEITGTYLFRVIRNATLAIREAEAEDLLETIEESLERRFFGYVVQLEVEASMPPDVRAWLVGKLGAELQTVQVSTGPLGLDALGELGKIDRLDLKDPPFVPSLPNEWPRDGSNVLDIIRRRDVLLHHPYNSFAPVVDFVRAGLDPNVLAIKQTLYRVGANSPIVDALLETRDDETQVAVMVELKARGDEESNIGWARALEEAGVHVAYGLLGLKTHCKLALIVRREADGLRRYVHLGTGNYNAQTARSYTDLGLFTADPDICADVSDVFNYLTGYSAQREFRKLIVAPSNMRRQLLELIAREEAFGERGRLILKMNALIDAEMIEALYRASRAGVAIDLIVRGACCLRPGVPGVSETIRVISIIGRFLEHSRIYYFGNGREGAGDTRDQIYLGSADMMPRNLNRRVEVLFPVESEAIKAQIRDEIIPLYLDDTMKSRELGADGVYHRRRPRPGTTAISAQATLLAGATALARP
jgi:polyphosphate kinase